MYDSVYHQTPVCTRYIIFEMKLKHRSSTIQPISIQLTSHLKPLNTKTMTYADGVQVLGQTQTCGRR